MAILLCPQCGNAAEVSKLPMGASAKCKRCAAVFPIGRPRSHWHRLAAQLRPLRSRRTLTVLGVTAGVLLLGAVSYVAARVSLNWHAQQEVAASDEESAAPAEPAKSEEPDASPAPVKATVSADEKKQVETARAKLDDEKKALDKERQELEALVKELKDKRGRFEDDQAKLDLQMKRRNPQLTAKLEEVAAGPEPYDGKLMYFDGVKLIGKSVEKLKDGERFTLSAISQGGTYFSRMPNASLVLSTSSSIAAALAAHMNGDGLIANIRVYGEIRKWDQKGAKKATPEVHIYRIDLFTASGDLSKVLE